MKYIKHPLINISLCAALFLCGGCGSEYEPDNGSIGTGSMNPVPLIIHATASGFGGLPAAMPSSTRTPVAPPVTRTPTEDGLETQFNAGDAIGIFAIKDGKIVDGISNTKLTYTIDASGAGSWNPPTGSELYWYEGVGYVAYYPYKDGITIDATQTTDNIIASLAAHASLQPGTDQATADKYTACDLMTATGTPVSDGTDESKKILNLDLKHQHALLVLKVHTLAPYKTSSGYIYYPPASDANLDAAATGLELDGVPVLRTGDGNFRIIMKPTAAATSYNGTYVSDGRRCSFQITTAASGYASGTCYTVWINTQLPDEASTTTTRELALGDFYYQDGSILPGDSGYQESAGNLCIGVVFYAGVGSSDSAGNYDGKLTGIHGYVLARNYATASWGDSSKQWASGNTSGFVGYTDCKKMKEAIESDGKSFPSYSYCASFTPAPTTGITSGWYFPSFAQVSNYIPNASRLAAYLTQIPGGSDIGHHYHSSSTESGSGNTYLKSRDEPSKYWVGNKGDGSYQVRAVLTF